MGGAERENRAIGRVLERTCGAQTHRLRERLTSPVECWRRAVRRPDCRAGLRALRSGVQWDGMDGDICRSVLSTVQSRPANQILV
jgi:hypothetical protein